MLNIIVPIAGKSYFFDEKKDGFPKPFIEICGKTMLELFIQNFSNIKEKHFIFILKENEVRRFHLDDSINILTNNKAKNIILQGESAGMACSCLMAIDSIKKDENVIIVNIDQIFELDLNNIMEKFISYDAGVISFESVHPRFAYVKCDENNLIYEAAEKKPISKNAIAGFYYFKTWESFLEGTKEMIKKDVNYEGKYFVSPVLNELILKNKKVINVSIDKNLYYTFYSPAKIREYERIKSEKI